MNSLNNTIFNEHPVPAHLKHLAYANVVYLLLCPVTLLAGLLEREVVEPVIEAVILLEESNSPGVFCNTKHVIESLQPIGHGL